MTTLTPHSTEGDVPGVVEIIKLLSDSAAYTKRLAELRGLAMTADSKLTEAKTLADKYAMAEKMIADATRLLADHKRRGEDLDRRENEVAAREGAIAHAERESKLSVDKVAKDHAERLRVVAAKEAEAADKHLKLSHRENQVKSRESSIARREDKLKEIAHSFLE